MNEPQWDAMIAISQSYRNVPIESWVSDAVRHCSKEDQMDEGVRTMRPTFTSKDDQMDGGVRTMRPTFTSK